MLHIRASEMLAKDEISGLLRCRCGLDNQLFVVAELA